MASQKPPVALVRSVTLIFSFAAALALAGGAAVAAAGALADGAAVGAALLPHAATSIAAAPSTTDNFNRVDMCVAPSCRIFLFRSAARCRASRWCGLKRWCSLGPRRSRTRVALGYPRWL